MSNQLVKRNPVEGYKNVFPKTFIDAIKDRESGASLEEIIQGFNMYFLSYNGSLALTRCKVPKALRKEGLWITYVLYDHTVVTEWYNSDNIDDESWGSDSNWRKASNALVGDISISTDGYWVINGTTTNIKAQGETGTTPLLRVGDNNKIQVTYDEGKNWEDISDYIVPKFRWNQGTGTTAGTIQISMDLGNTWKDLSNPITNNLRISKYIGINESLPASGVAEGTVYMKGPYYDENDSLNENPIYRMWVYAWKGNTLAWQDNGEFTSISAGVVQERGTSTTQVMSQDAVTRELTELESNIGTTIYEYNANVPVLIYGNYRIGEVLYFETSEDNEGATTLGGYIVGGGFEDIIIASPPGRMHRIVLNNSYDRLSLFSAKSCRAKVYMEDSVNQKLNSINTELGGIDARIESATTTQTDISSEFVSGYWNTNDGVGQQAYFSESSTLFTLKTDITKGQIFISNTELATNQAVSHALLDDNNTIIALLTTQELNNGVQITDAIIESGATNIVITYRSTLQTTTISCIIKERVTDSIENIKSELQEIENDKTIYRHYVSKTQDTIFVYTKGYAIGEDLCCRMMNRNINGIWDFFDWQRIPNTTDIVASTFDGHILINGGTGTDYISAYTVAAVNNADGDSQVINPTGGWHGYNSLTANVTATARTIMARVFADGKEVGENEGAYCNDVKIMLVNNIQGWNTQKVDGTGREILQQKCTITFNKFNINVEIETTALEDVKLIKHYGLNAQNNMNSSDVVVQFVGDTTTIQQGSNGQSSDKEARMLIFFGDNDNFAIEIADFGEGTYKYNALDYSGIYVGGTRKGYFACIYRNPDSEQDWVELAQGATLFLRGAYKCSLSR